jgi:hypothetical protein
MAIGNTQHLYSQADKGLLVQAEASHWAPAGSVWLSRTTSQPERLKEQTEVYLTAASMHGTYIADFLGGVLKVITALTAKEKEMGISGIVRPLAELISVGLTTIEWRDPDQIIPLCMNWYRRTRRKTTNR